MKEATSNSSKESWELALEILDRVGVTSLPGLGNLRPEVEKAELFLARTLPEPYAPKRFFSVALSLERRSLAALHIHEALHRALP